MNLRGLSLTFFLATLATTFPSAANARDVILQCGPGHDPNVLGFWTAHNHGIRFTVHEDFSVIKVLMRGHWKGTYIFDAELRRSKNFLTDPEKIRSDVVVTEHESYRTLRRRGITDPGRLVRLPFGRVAVSGPETFTLRLVEKNNWPRSDPALPDAPGTGSFSLMVNAAQPGTPGWNCRPVQIVESTSLSQKPKKLGRTGSFQVLGPKGGDDGQARVFLVHGLNQSLAAMEPLGSRLDQSLPDRYVVDWNFYWSDCNRVLCHPQKCKLGKGARKLAEHIRDNTNAGDRLVLVGYSMGGLLARDMLLDHYDTYLGSREISGLVTLGTPHLGYPYCASDEARCPAQLRQMASDLRTQPDMPRFATYLRRLNTRWSSASFPGLPGEWLAVAGTPCRKAVREAAPGIRLGCIWDDPGVINEQAQGCPQNSQRSDGVVCELSALYQNWANGPSETFSSDELRHTSGWGERNWKPLCRARGKTDLYDFDESTEVFQILTDFIKSSFGK